MREIVSFWCQDCGLDQDLEAYPFANKWEARCKGCGRSLWRLRKEIENDPYYRKSEKLRIQRKMMKKDLLQPGESGFKTLYPETVRQLEQAEENFEKKQKEDRERRDRLYKKYHHDINRREVLKKAINNAELWT